MDFNFELTGDESRAVAAIVDRAATMQPNLNRLRLTMDITACHNHAVKLDLDGLLGATVEDFVHDLNGIGNHLDRQALKLEGVFSPRYARRTQ